MVQEMSVEELIEKLNQIQDKQKKIKIGVNTEVSDSFVVLETDNSVCLYR